ncbi:hypothetical protein ACOB3G_002344 [Vibrio cholerae]
MQDSNNYLKINWYDMGAEGGFTQLPYQVSKLNKVKGKEFNLQSKILWSYLASQSLKYGKSHVTISQEALCTRFGVSRDTMRKWLATLKEKHNLIHYETEKGKTSKIEVYEIPLGDGTDTPSKSEFQGSNNRKTHEKPNNFMIAKKYRKLFEDEPDKVKALNKFIMEADKNGVKLDSGKIQEFFRSLEQPTIEHPQTPTVEQSPPMQQPQAEPMLCNGDESYFTEQPPLSVYENDYVVEDEDLEVVIESQVSIEDCPKFVMCEREWQSVIESYTGTDTEQATQQASEPVAPSQTDEVIERVEPPITPPPEKAIPNLEELLLECGLLPFTRAGALKDTLKAFPVDKVIAVNKKLTEESYYCKECGNYTHNAEFCNFAGCSSIPF